MRWLDLGVLLAAGGDFLLAGLNCGWLARLAAAASSPARRLGAAALALVNLGLALEALLFLSLASRPSQSPPALLLAMVAVRGALLASAGLISLLLWRASSQG